jgi:hypothetical protein
MKTSFKTTLMSLIVSAPGYGPASAGAQTMVWSDEFNDDVNDTGTWTYDIGGWGFGNGQDAGNTP